MALGVVDRLFATHAPHAHRSQRLEVRREGARPDLEADLVVSFPGGAVRDGGRAVTTGGGNQVMHDDRARQGRDERIATLVQCIGGQSRHGDVRQQFLACVHHLDLDGPSRDRPLSQRFEIDILADVNRDSDHFVSELSTQPADRDRRIKTARIGERYPLFHFIPTFLGLAGFDWGASGE